MAKRPALEVRPPKNADEFVSGGTPPPARQPLEAQPSTVDVPKRGRGRPRKYLAPAAAPAAPTPKRKRGYVMRADGTQLTQISIYLEATAGDKFRRYCFENGLTMSDVAGQVMAKFVAKL